MDSSFTTQYLAAIGKISTSTAELDWKLLELLGDVLQDDMLALLLWAGNRNDRMLEILSASFYSKGPEKDAVLWFKYIVRTVQHLQDRRNENIHSRWTFIETRHCAIRSKVKKPKDGVVHGTVKNSVDLSELEEVSRDVTALIDEIGLFRNINFRNPSEQIDLEELTKWRTAYDHKLKKLKAEEAKGKKKRIQKAS